MMESANSHYPHPHHHHQGLDQLAVGSCSSSSTSSCSSSFATAPCYGVGATAHAWNNPSPFLNTPGFNHPYTTESGFLRETRLQDDDVTPLISPHFTPMSPDLSFNWANSPGSFNFPNQSPQDLPLSRIKEEFSDQYLRKYNEILSISNSSSSSSSCTDDSSGLIRSSEQRNFHPTDDLGTRLLLKSFSSGNLMNKIHFSPGEQLYPNSGRVGLSQIFPSINVSNLSHQTGLANPAGSLDMNLDALDLLVSSRFRGNLGPSSTQNQVGMSRDGFPNFGFDLMQQESNQIPLFSCNKASPALSNGSIADTKRSSKIEPKVPLQSAPKKSRLEARASCPPFKVRKEKLGDRIAALQQLVAPFGKTDTASVLMEAIGYIKFLQNQVETLSVPYMKASRNKSSRPIKGGNVGETENYQDDVAATKRDLKSRGLCLVPLSCLSYITDGGGAVVWPPSHFGGAT